MAFKLSPEAQSVFFIKLFGSGHAVTQKVKDLTNAGVIFEVALYTVKASGALESGKVGPSQMSLTHGSTSLMKNTVSPHIVAQNKAALQDWIDALHAKAFGTYNPVVEDQALGVNTLPGDGPTTVILEGPKPGGNMLTLIKAVQTVTGKGLSDSKAIAEAAVNGTAQALKTFPTVAEAQKAVALLMAAGGKTKMTNGEIVFDLGADQLHVKKEKTLYETMAGATEAVENLSKAMGGDPKPVNKVIDLKAAQVVGQKVHGTSTGSVYHTIALTDHLRLAARLYTGGSISIRAEWTDNPTEELKKLEAAGVQMKKNYGSIHFDSAGVPVQRVIGAFLMGTGISWKQMLMSGEKLVVTPQA